MSDEEQVNAIGRMVSERAAAKREAAILERKIEDFGNWIYEITVALRSPGDPAPRLQEAIANLNDAGGIDRLKILLSDYKDLRGRISGLTRMLIDAGVE